MVLGRPVSEDIFGALTLALALLASVAGLSCAAFVLWFHVRVGKEGGGSLLALRSFESPWLTRIILTSFAVLWALNEILFLSFFKKKGWPFHNLDFASQANICRVQTVVSLGFTEPGFLLTTLLLLHTSLDYTSGSSSSSSSRRSLNKRVLRLLLLFCLPVFASQAAIMAANSSAQFNSPYNEDKEGYNGAIPSYFTKAFDQQSDEEFSSNSSSTNISSNRHIALCTRPLLNVLLLGLFDIVFVITFLFLDFKVVRRVINRKLKIRAWGLFATIATFVPLQVLFMAIGARSDPGETSHEVFAFLGFLAALIWTAVGEGLLVVFPILDALTVGWIINRRFRSWRSFSHSSVESFSLPETSRVNDNTEESSMHIELVSNSVSSPSIQSFRELTLGPSNWIAQALNSTSSPLLNEFSSLRPPNYIIPQP